MNYKKTKKITLFIAILIIINMLSSSFASATTIHVYSETLQEDLPLIRQALVWEKSKEHATEWNGKDRQKHYRDGGSEQEYYDEFWAWQLDYILSPPIEELEELREKNPNFAGSESEYDGINFKDQSGRRMFLWVALNSDRMYDDFVVTLQACGVTGNLGFYQEFYPPYRGGPGVEWDGSYGYYDSGVTITDWGGHGSVVDFEAMVLWFLENTDFSPEQIAAILVNLWFESRWKNNAYNPDDCGSPSIGLAQWHEKRIQLLQEFCRERGLDYTTWEAQLAYLAHEALDDEFQAKWRIWTADRSSGKEGFMNLGHTLEDVKNGVYIWAADWERCADPGERKASETLIEDVYNQVLDIVKGKQTPTSPAPSSKPQSSTKPQPSTKPTTNPQPSTKPTTNPSSSSQANSVSSFGEYSVEWARENLIGVRYYRYWEEGGCRRDLGATECVGVVSITAQYLGLPDDFGPGSGVATPWFANGAANAAGHSVDYYFDIIPASEMQPGDFFLTNIQDDGTPGHIAMYSGDHNMIDASSGAGQVLERDMGWIYNGYGGIYNNVCYRWKPEILEAAGVI